MHWAASVGATEVVRYLTDQGADVIKVDSSGWAALHIASMIVHRRRIRPILSWFRIVSAGHEEIVHELIGAGADVNQRNDKGITPLCDMPQHVSRFVHTTLSTGIMRLPNHA